ncbi:MAG TPA: fatty acyl-AMP ligase [Solirubrobacterales bacterium]|nr:fatty acyl-AMP ligase [Solirubrobacterales bacterium]
MSVRSFGGILATLAERRPEAPAFTFLGDDLDQVEEVTYGGLHRRAQSIAAALVERCAPGDRVLLLFPPGLDYVAAVFGCFQAAVVGVSAPPPHPRRLQRTLGRLTRIAGDAEVVAVLTTGAIRDAARGFVGDALAGPDWIAIDALPAADREYLREPGADDLAFLQYTSGSTQDPRGVMLSHENLLSNSRAITEAFGAGTEGDEVRGLIWLPPYHDMGLIGGILQPVHLGKQCVLMSPLTVVKRPQRWLEAISRYRATTSGGPNFAYDLCVRRIDAEVRERLDLSSWRVAFNGAEPIRAETIAAFGAAFGPSGFARSAFLPCYGLAEATLIVTGADDRSEPALLEVDPVALEDGRLEPARAGGATRTLVGCGAPYRRHQLRIVDPERRVASAEGRVGEIWVAGPGVALGYWKQEELTADHFGARLAGEEEVRYLRTGDLGALLDGELYVVGRIKELILVNGRNLHPHDIEFVAESAYAGLRRHSSAAFDRGGPDGPVRPAILLELDQGVEADGAAVIAAVRRRVAADLELALDWVGLCPSGTIPKTTSGKIQRGLCRELVEGGEIELSAWSDR